MKKYLLILYFLLYSFNITNNYILIPFDIFIDNPTNNNNFQNDILSMKFSEDIYINLTLGNPEKTTKLLLRIDQYEIIIKESFYKSEFSNSFKFNKFVDEKFICNETFSLFTINNSKELNEFLHKDKNNIEKNKYKEYKDIRFIYLNKTNYNYLEKEEFKEDAAKILSYNYGLIGLKLRKMNIGDYSPEFIKSIREIKGINSSIFTFYFNDNKKDNHYGYLIIGDKFIDNENEFEETNSTYFGMRDGSLSWNLRTNTISSQPKISSNNLNVYVEKNKVVKLLIEKSFIYGTMDYKKFLDDNFFNELVSQKICIFKKLIIDKDYGGYICDSKSKIFIDSYNNKFPELIFKNENFADELVLTEKDLFFYNKYNKSDSNIYFIIFFSTSYNTKWMLGRPFFEKFRLSFDIDKSHIIYHKKKYKNDNQNNIENNNTNNYQKDNKFVKIIIIIFLILIIFTLGFLFHKAMTKIPRKKKANELDDEFYYPTNDKNKKLYNKTLDINNNDNINRKDLLLELGTKNI